MNRKFRYIFVRSLMILVLAFVIILSYVQPVHAAIFDDDGIITQGEEINDDVFLSGERVSMEGVVDGLLIASGQTITIKGKVTGDAILSGNTIIISDSALIEGNLIILGKSVNIEGKINGSLIGGSVWITIINASIGRNVYFGAYSIETRSGSVINRDLYVSAYQVILGGEIGQDAYAAAGAIEMNGKIGKSAKFEVGEPDTSGINFIPKFFLPSGTPLPISPGLRISEDSQIGGQLIYTSQVDQNSSVKSAPEGGTVFITPVPDIEDEPSSNPNNSGDIFSTLSGRLLNIIRNVVTLILIGSLILLLLPDIFEKSVAQAKMHLFPSAGYGIVTILAGYAIGLLGAVVIILVGVLLGNISLGGLSISFFSLGFSLLALAFVVFTLLVGYGSKLIVSFLAGAWIINKFAPNAAPKKGWALAVGAFTYVCVRAIPFLGWFVGLVITLIGVGAMWLQYRAWKKPSSENIET